MIGIYKIENTENGMVYIGKSDDIMRRWEQHIKSLENNSHANARLQKDWNNYKINCFNFSILRTCDKSELSEYEQFYINKYFNIASIYNSQIKTLDKVNNKESHSNVKIDINKEDKNNLKEPKRKTLNEADYDLIYIPNGTKIGGNRFKSITGKLILYMFQYIYTNDRINIKDNNEISLSVSEFLKKTKNNFLTIYRDLSDIDSLNVKINNTNLINDFSYKKGVVHIVLSEEGKKLLLDKSNYKKYNLEISKMNEFINKNSIKMFILLTQENLNNPFSIDYLKKYFNANGKSYNEYSAFRVKYIQPMLKDLKSIGYNYTYEEIKFGRKVCELKFIKS